MKVLDSHGIETTLTVTFEEELLSSKPRSAELEPGNCPRMKKTEGWKNGGLVHGIPGSSKYVKFLPFGSFFW